MVVVLDAEQERRLLFAFGPFAARQRAYSRLMVQCDASTTDCASEEPPLPESSSRRIRRAHCEEEGGDDRTRRCDRGQRRARQLLCALPAHLYAFLLTCSTVRANKAERERDHLSFRDIVQQVRCALAPSGLPELTRHRTLIFAGRTYAYLPSRRRRDRLQTTQQLRRFHLPSTF